MQRDLTHAPYKFCVTQEHTFLWTLVTFSTFNLHVFLQLLHVFFLTTFMIVITYTIIPTYKYPSILSYFLTPYHFLSLYFSFFFLFFNSLWSLAVNGGQCWGKWWVANLGEVINPWDWRWEKPQEGGVELCFWKLLLLRSR